MRRACGAAAAGVNAASGRVTVPSAVALSYSAASDWSAREDRRWWRRQGPQRRRQLALPGLRECGIRGFVSACSGVAPARRGASGGRVGRQIACSCQFARVFGCSVSRCRLSAAVASSLVVGVRRARAVACRVGRIELRTLLARLISRRGLRARPRRRWIGGCACGDRVILRGHQQQCRREQRCDQRNGRGPQYPRLVRGCRESREAARRRLHRSTARVVAAQARHRARARSRAPREKSRRRSRPPGAGRPTLRTAGPRSA